MRPSKRFSRGYKCFFKKKKKPKKTPQRPHESFTSTTSKTTTITEQRSHEAFSPHGARRVCVRACRYDTPVGKEKQRHVALMCSRPRSGDLHAAWRPWKHTSGWKAALHTRIPPVRYLKYVAAVRLQPLPAGRNAAESVSVLSPLFEEIRVRG